MSPLDWTILGFTLLMALVGYSRGLLVGGLALAGFVGGAFAGARLGPLVLEEGSHSPYAPLFALAGAIFLGAIVASLLEALGFRVRNRLGDGLGVIDGFGGALFVGALGLGIVWIVGAVALQTPGARSLREPIQRSLILRELNAVLPPSGPILQALARFDPFPRIDGPSADVAPPRAAILRDPDVAEAANSVVKVLGTACGLGVQGSGWVAADGVVVTNAHVVAGQDDTTVQVGATGARVDAQAIWFDPRNDIALLSAPGLSGTPALSLASDPSSGTPGAVLGFPGNGPFDAQPARLGRTYTVLSEDAYGHGPVQRSITSLRGLVRSGNSGGPVVGADGGVLATVFAASASSESPAGYGVPDSVVGEALAQAGEPVGTGPCAR